MSAITVTVVYALPDRATELEVSLARGATVADALARSGIAALHPDVDVATAPIGIFGRPAQRDRVLADGDRVEVYRPLAADAKEARRRRAQQPAQASEIDCETTGLKSLLDAVRRGDKPALDELFSLLYRELRRLAHARLARGRSSPHLDTTSLVHESYLRCLKARALDVADRSHFLAYAAKVMRSIVVDVARSQQAERRGGEAAHLTLDTDLAESVRVSIDQLVGIDDALHDVARIDERLVRVVEMRFFAGLTEEETAAALGLTERTIRRDWEKARILLRAALG